MDKLYKIIYCDDLRIHMAVMEEIPEKIYFPEEFDTPENRLESVTAASIAAVLASDLKETNSSVTVMLRNVEKCVSYSVTAQQDGRVCGAVDGYTKGVLKDGYILEVVRRSGIGRDYSSVVCGSTVEAVIDEYITGKSPLRNISGGTNSITFFSPSVALMYPAGLLSMIYTNFSVSRIFPSTDITSFSETLRE
jgi:hypothetical protein